MKSGKWTPHKILIIYLSNFRDKHPDSSVVKWQENYREEHKS